MNVDIKISATDVRYNKYESTYSSEYGHDNIASVIEDHDEKITRLVSLVEDTSRELMELKNIIAREEKMREEYPALKKAWDHYQFTKQVVTDGTDD